MNARRRLAALTLAAAAWVAARDARDARAAQVVGHVEPGVIIPRGFPALGVRPTAGGDVTVWWSPSARFDLGLESGIAATVFRYSNPDGEPFLGEYVDRSSLLEDFTLLPRVMFGARLHLTAATSIAASVGLSHIWAVGFGEYVLIPFPTAAVAAETRFGAGGRYGLRAAFSTLTYDFDGRALMSATLAFAWGS
jgi:hypothetical protein